MRDLDSNPYTKDEQRVADYIGRGDIGAGDDPISSLITFHGYLIAQNKLLRDIVRDMKLLDNSGQLKQFEGEPWLNRIRSFDMRGSK